MIDLILLFTLSVFASIGILFMLSCIRELKEERKIKKELLRKKQLKKELLAILEELEEKENEL